MGQVDTLLLGQVPALDPAQGRQWIPNYDQIISALNGLTLAGLLFAAGVIVIGGATWALAANRAHTQGVTSGRSWSSAGSSARS